MKNVKRKTFFIATICLLSANFLNAQKDTTFTKDGYQYVQSFEDKNKIKQIIYYPNGNINSVGKKRTDVFKTNEAGGEYGKWIFYYENGQKKEEGEFRIILVKTKRGFFKVSEKKGKWFYWNENGKLMQIQIYRRGHIRKLIEYDDAGNKKQYKYKVPLRLFGRYIGKKRKFPI